MTLGELEKLFKNKINKEKHREEMENRRIARICCIIANSNRDSKKKPKPFTEDDFMPKKETKQNKSKKMTPSQMANVLKVITLANGGKVVS